MTVVPGTIDDDDGALTEVGVFPPASGAQSATPKRTGVATLALFDTGSEVTLIQEGIAANLGIVPHDARDIVTIDNRIVRCNVFAITLTFPDTSLVIEDLWVAEAGFEAYSRADVQVIIGRSVLRKGTFTYNGWDRLFTFEVTNP